MSKESQTIRPEDLPNTELLEAELKRVRYKKNYAVALRSTIYTLITVSALAILVAVLLLPVLRIYGESMNPVLTEGDIVISLKGSRFEIGDVIAFYYNNKILVKRVIANSGDWVDIDEDGSVSICGEDENGMQKALNYVNTIVAEYEEGQIYEGEVVSIKDFGAFIEFAPGKEGMVHISRIARHRIAHVEDVLTLGDRVKVKCLGKDKMGRMSFSIRDAE